LEHVRGFRRRHRSYAAHIRAYFGYEGVSYGTETKVFGEPNNWNPAD
jgi:hypothetical protein